MRNLEQRIVEWRDGLKVSPELKEELEGHLREAIDAKLKDGKSGDEAFRLAVAEMGGTEKISAEYSKMERATWWPVRAAVWGTIALAGVLSLVYFAVLHPTQPKEYASLRWVLAPHVVTVTFGYSLTYLLGALGICFGAHRFVGDLSPGQTRSLTKAMFHFSWVATVFTAAGVVLGMVWTQYAWGRLWAWDVKETGAAALLIWQLFFLAFQASRYAKVERTMLLSIAGNIVVSAAWFGGTSTLILMTIIVVHVAILGVFSAKSRATALS
jgi:hypothetical protein